MKLILRQFLATILSFAIAAPMCASPPDYDTRNRLTNLGVTGTVSGAAGAIASYAYTLDASGHRTGVTELSGRNVAYGYDNLYRLTSETIASDPNAVNGVVSYVYDAVGNRKQKTSTLPGYPGGLLNYNPSAALRAGANDQLATDTYDSDGNTIGSGANTGVNGYVYDFENHLIQQSGISIVYDGDGNRASKTVGGATTTYLVDTRSPTGYAQVLQETFNGARGATYELSHTYVYGLEQISERRYYFANNQGNYANAYYVHDGHGSVRALTDPTGTVTDTYDYDAFGNLIHSTGTTPNNYLYSGEQYDPDLNLYYNRARYLNTSTSRFLTADPSEGQSDDPASIHRYLYARDNPVSLFDPAGLDYTSDPGTGLEVQTVIGEQFRLQFGGNGCVNQQLINILASDCSAPWEFGLGFPGGLRPDLANIQTGALFEIKPIKSAADALVQLAGYRIILALADGRGRNWHLGSAGEFTPPTVIPLPRARVAYVAPPVFGVIIYFVADARDAFDLSLLLASRILPALLRSSGAAAAARGASNVISISRGVGIAGAAAEAEGAEIELNIGTAEALAPAA